MRAGGQGGTAADVALQDPDHAERLVDIADEPGVHLAHVTAGGFGTHGDAVESLRRCIDLCRRPDVTGEFLTAALRPGLGNRDGVLIDREAQSVAFEALREGVIDVLTSDGQCDATMKGFGDTRENVSVPGRARRRGDPRHVAVDRDDDGQSGAPAC